MKWFYKSHWKIFLKIEENFDFYVGALQKLQDRFELFLKNLKRPVWKLWKNCADIKWNFEKNWEIFKTVFRRHLKVVQKSKQYSCFRKIMKNLALKVLFQETGG